MTKELLQQKMKEVKDKMQNDFIDDLFDRVQNLCEKAIKKDYEPTEHERIIFNQIRIIITNMQDWF